MQCIMGWSLTIGRIAGTAIRLHFTFLLFLAWIGIADYLAGGPAAAAASVVFIILVFACVVAHEFGHILMARRFGIKTPEVILSPIGGIANMDRIPDVPMQELLVAIAGPLVNVAIGLALFAGLGLDTGALSNLDFEKASLLERLTLVNISLVLFNLVPAFPMDGGRVLRALLAMRFDAGKATQIAARVGQGFSFLFVLLGLFYSPILMLVGIFIYFAAAAEEQTAAFTSFARNLLVKDAMEAAPITLDQSARLADAVDKLLATPQRDFPIIDDAGQVIGILDREAMLAGLHRGGADTVVREIMRKTEAMPQDLPLVEAFSRMRSRGSKAEAVADRGGRLVGVLTFENIAEMMMVENIKPGWSFTRRS
jgi:Zn-dependent protease